MYNACIIIFNFLNVLFYLKCYASRIIKRRTFPFHNNFGELRESKDYLYGYTLYTYVRYLHLLCGYLRVIVPLYNITLL